jgi:hypothetical protein
MKWFRFITTLLNSVRKVSGLVLSKTSSLMYNAVGSWLKVIDPYGHMGRQTFK